MTDVVRFVDYVLPEKPVKVDKTVVISRVYREITHLKRSKVLEKVRSKRRIGRKITVGSFDNDIG